MRILHVVHRYPPAIGGAERWCAGVARWQAAQGHEVTVLTLRAVYDDDVWGDGIPQGGAIAVGPSDLDAGVRVHRGTPGAPGPAIQRVLVAGGFPVFTRSHSSELYGRLLRAARAHDVVHAHALPLPHVWAAWGAARLARRWFVLTPHLHPADPLHRLHRVPWLLRRADHVVVLTQTEAGMVRRHGVDADRITVVPAATVLPSSPTTTTAIRQELGVHTDVALLCFLGRKARTKGLDVLFRALPLVRHRPAPVLAVAGPSTDWYAQLPRPGGVVDLPALSERAKTMLLAAADLLVLPSAAEAFGIVFLEAWAAGTPVLGADIASVREVIGDAGATFRAGDAGDLAARIDALLADPAESRGLGVRGRARVAAQYTWDRVGAAVLAAYDTVRSRAAAVPTTLEATP